MGLQIVAFRVLNNKASQVSQQEILNRIQKGDETALNLLYKKYYKMMIKLIIRNSGTEAEGQDIYQEALISLWKRVRSGELKIYSKISTYLYSVCMNLWRKELNRKKRFTDESYAANRKIDTVCRENKEIVEQCLAKLDDTCKKVLTYYYFDGMQMQDIANELGFANANTAKTRKYKCKDKLKKLIEAKYTKKDLLD